ncbi:hypothetical protein BN2475_1370017 [Paraburkholderia ribeironis]|uniref:Uncharacterized protein n=1 Tax=Paraburkholderia ribeironis TaxID=1247936 RepID=A0A1N7SPI3_9BURK|nr:hypothetical protein BN2475_1370017 [Paraburkholderia ribeironis]
MEPEQQVGSIVIDGRSIRPLDPRHEELALLGYDLWTTRSAFGWASWMRCSTRGLAHRRMCWVIRGPPMDDYVWRHRASQERAGGRFGLVGAEILEVFHVEF